MASENRKIIETAVDRYKHNKSSFFVKASSLKPKQLSNAVKHIAKGEKEENIVAMMDITVLSSGKKGMVITEDKVYFNDCFAIAGNHIRKYSNIDSLCRVEKTDDDHHYVCLYRPAPEEGHMYLDRISCNIYQDDIYNFFQTMLDLLSKEKPAENKLKKVPRQPEPEHNSQSEPKVKSQTPVQKEIDAREKETVSVLFYGRDAMATKKIFDGLMKESVGRPVKPSCSGVKESFEANVRAGFKGYTCTFSYRDTSLGYTNPDDDVLVCVENDYEFVSGMRFGNSVIEVPGNAKNILVCLWHDAYSYPVRDVQESIESYHTMNPRLEAEFFTGIELDENGVCKDTVAAQTLGLLFSTIEDMLL